MRFNNDHDPSQWLGRAYELIETAEGMDIALKVADGPAGDKALRLAFAKQKTGLSMEVDIDSMDTEPDPQDPTVLLVTMANLTGVGHVKDPAFDDSRIMSVTASADSTEMEPGMEPDKQQNAAPATQPVTAPTTPPTQPAAPQAAQVVTPEASAPAAVAAPTAATFSMDDLLKVVHAMKETNSAPAAQAVAADAGVPVARPVVDPTAQAATFAAGGTAQVTEPLPYHFTRQGGRYLFKNTTEHDFSSDVFGLANAQMGGESAPEGAQKRVSSLIKAAFDVDTTDVAGLNPKVQRPDMWYPQRDYPTPLWDMINAGTTDGRPFELPKYDSSSGLVSAATEGTEPAPGAFAVTTQTITPTQLWGKVEITRQTIRRGGNPQTSGVIWEQMLRSYFEAREAAVATFLATLTAAADIAIPQTSGAPDASDDQAGVAALQSAIADLQFVRGGNTFTALAAHQFLYRMLARAEDDAGRPLLPIINPMNANGSSQTLYKAIDVAGTLAVPAYALGAASGTDSVNSWLFDPFTVRGWASNPDRLEWDFGATVQNSTRIPQLSMVTLGIYGDIALGNLDINGVRQITYDPTGS